MAESVLNQTDSPLEKGSRKSRAVLLGVILAGSTALVLVYHLLALMGQQASQVTRLGYELILVIGLGSLWLLLANEVGKRRPTPARSFWSTVVVATVVILVSQLILLVGRPPVDVDPAAALGFDLETGAPLVPPTVFKMYVTGLLYGGFAVILMLRMRDLVLVKRTKSTQRNWRLLLISMLACSATFLFLEPGEQPGDVQNIGLVIAVVFMVVSSFRLSWIVFLSFQEKMAGIGLSLMLLIILGAGIPKMSDALISQFTIPGTYGYLEAFSTPVAVFSSLAAIFGLLYSLTALLSLIFHLPTTGEFQARAGERAAMQSLTNIVGQVLDEGRLHAAIASSTVEAGVAQFAWLALSDLESNSLRARVAGTSRITEDNIREAVDLDALFNEALESRNPIVLEQAGSDHRVRTKGVREVGSMIIAPLVGRDRTLGALFACKDVIRGFERDEVDTIGILAAQATLALENASLFEKQVEQERVARELAIAREVQQRLLPQHVPVMPGVSIAASSVAAQEVGGDYYDFAPLGDHRLGIIIADVSGKGTSAAFYMAEMQGIFHALSQLTSSPRSFLEHANRAIGQSLDRNVFVSGIYGVIDTEKQEFVLARAGHCPAAAVDLGGNARYLRSNGIGLGLDRGDIFAKTLGETTVSLQPGDVFVLYTDGVVESRSPSGDEYGYDRLLSVLSDVRQEDASDIHDHLLADLNEFITKEGEYGDDMTLVVLKWHGLPLATDSPEPHMAQAPLPA